MRALLTQKENAIRLRKLGKTYNEILAIIPVAKSTLSLWLRDVGLAKRQTQRITARRKAAQKRGGLAKSSIRIVREQELIESARAEIESLSMRELKLIGTALYWAEGSKAKPHNVSQGLDFGNSDVRMVLVFLTWLRRCLDVSIDRISASLYIHENCKDRLEDVKKFWLTKTGLPPASLRYVYFKKHRPTTKRKNRGNSYFGLLRIHVKSSTDLNRTVQGWTLGISEQCGTIE